MKVYFVTNRQPDDPKNPTSFLDAISSEGVSSIRFGVAEMAKSKDGAWSVEALSAMPENLSVDPPILGSQTQFNELRAAMSAGANVLAFIHGFNVELSAALADAANMASIYASKNVPIIPVVFSWPSKGKLLGYINDRSTAKSAAPALARAMMKAIGFLHDMKPEDACGQRIHLLAHSMGNYVLRHALLEIQTEYPRGIPRALGEIILVSADEDSDAFDLDYKFAKLAHLGHRVTVYFNRNDFALTMSDKVKFNPTRLGQHGPEHPHNIPANVTLVDCTQVASNPSEDRTIKDWLFDELQQHRYHTYNETVIRDIQQVLAGVPQERTDPPVRTYVPHENKYTL